MVETQHAASLRGRLGYQTSHNISPPTPVLRAWRPVITPLGVVRMLIPMPPNTRGISVRRTYTRQPGRDTLSTQEIAASLLLPYFRYTRTSLWPSSSVGLKFAM